MPASAREGVQKRIARYHEEAKRYESEKNEKKAQAEALDKQYDSLNMHESEAYLTIGMALLGVSALVKKRWLFFFAVVMAGIGAALELSGFLGWSFHPQFLSKLLG